MTAPVYRDPRALRQAVTDRLRRLANERSASELSDLQRQFAFDRLLSRVFQAAMATVARFIDPVLSDLASGWWDPERLRWGSAGH
jgi:hypothetical protein